MSQFYTTSGAEKFVENLITMVGPPRSGSSMLSKILFTCERVEILFEPPLLYSVLPLVPEIGHEKARMILGTFLYHDVLIEHLAGRTINTNPHDYSSFVVSKSQAELDERFSKSWSHQELAEMAPQYRLLMKINGLTTETHHLMDTFPESTLILTYRNPNNVMQSMLNKRWMSNEKLGWREGHGLIRSKSGLEIPYWVPDEYVDEFVAMSEVNRVGMFFARTVGGEALMKRSIMVSYDELTEKPRAEIPKLFEKLGLKPGAKTDEKISEVHPSRPTEDFYSQLDPAIKKMVDCSVDLAQTYLNQR